MPAKNFNKKYNKEEKDNFMNFLKNVAMIDHHNEAYNTNQSSYKLGITQFADLKEIDISKFQSTVNFTGESKTNHYEYTPRLNVDDIPRPTWYDWQDHCAVSEVVDLGECRSDWAFTTIGMLEAYFYRKTTHFTPLSKQELIECSRIYRNNGCSGGSVKYAFEYIKQNGISTETTYPFQLKEQKCRIHNTQNRIHIHQEIDLKRILQGNENVMMNNIFEYGPLAAKMYAPYNFFFYKEGIFTGEDCQPNDKIDHNVLIVGYGIEPKTAQEYWIVKNWWGNRWGEQGYARIERNKNTCGIANEVWEITPHESYEKFNQPQDCRKNQQEFSNTEITLPTSNRKTNFSDVEKNMQEKDKTQNPNSKQITKNESSLDIGELLIILLVFLVFILVIGGVCLHMWHKRKEKRLLEETNNAIALGQWIKTIVIQKVNKESDFLQTPLVKIQMELKSNKKTSDFAENSEYVMFEDSQWEFLRENLRLHECLGEGEFGKVVKAEAKSIIQPGVWSPVAVKMLKDFHTDEEMVNLVSELEIMKMMEKHTHILSLLGCCTQKGPFFIITEYAMHGNLKDFLRQYSPDTKKSVAEPENELVLNNRTLISFSSHVAKGMEYLASIKCIHRDLAARNILVCEGYTMKIADFGLARDVHKDEYYKKNTNGKIPIKWMAPESIFQRLFTCKSDVWSYGILLWEIMTFGGTPYPAVTSGDEILELLRQGYRMKSPTNCPSELYTVMLKCWNKVPQDRPTFSNILQDLDEILEEKLSTKRSSEHNVYIPMPIP